MSEPGGVSEEEPLLTKDVNKETFLRDLPVNDRTMILDGSPSSLSVVVSAEEHIPRIAF